MSDLMFRPAGILMQDCMRTSSQRSKSLSAKQGNPPAHSPPRHTLILVLLLIFQPLCSLTFAAKKADADSETSFAELQQSFKTPPDDARIMMRWWWFGPAVQKRELEREMRPMKEGGIGGVEVQPVYPLALDDPDHGIRNLPYLSDEFIDMLHFASEKARELGLRFDLTLGSGWPYGGPQVPITEAAGSLRIVRMDVSRDVQAVPLPAITNGEEFIAAFLHQFSPASAWIPVSNIREGTISLPPTTEEKRELLIFIASRTGMMVKRAAAGAEGF